MLSGDGARLDLRTQAEEALRLAPVEPQRAQGLAVELLQQLTDSDPAVAVAERALGLALLEQQEITQALSHLERSVALARKQGSRKLVALGEKNLSLALAAAGETEAALAHADRAATVLRGVELARVHAQRAIILQRLGRNTEALAGYRRALTGMRRADDVEGQARVIANRGLLRAYSGQYHLAEADLRRAEDHFLVLDMTLPAALVHHSLGFVAARRGDIPLALARYDHAEQAAADYRRSVRLLDRFEALMSVRLMDEARRVGELAAAELQAQGTEVDLAEARLLLAQAALIDGDARKGEQLATLARDAFIAQNRPGWAALARYAQLRARWQSPDHDADLLRAAQATANELDEGGWPALALDARLIGAQLALELGLGLEADGQKLLRSTAVRRSDPADLQARAFHARALLRVARGDTRGADAALRAGMRVLTQHQATLGATELRVHASVRAEELARMGIRLALRSKRPRRVLSWAERWRAGALLTRPARPPADPRLAELLTQLRHTVSELEQAGFSARDSTALLRRQASLEAAVSRRARHAAGGPAADSAPPTAADLYEALDGRGLIEFVECDGSLYAVTLAGDKTRLHSLGSHDDLRDETEALGFALERLARGLGSEMSRAGAAQAFAFGARRLDDLLMAPLRQEIGDRRLVIVPTGDLHALPWAALPSCRGRPFAVAPSAASWLRAARLSKRGGPAVLVAGPGLPGARAEIAELATVYRDAARLAGDAATTNEVAAALDGAGLAHIAAHGSFRTDNPLFSSVRLSDGPLTVYDLERLSRAPLRVVLSACNTGLALARPGDELMGLSSAFLALGTRTLVASVVPMPDTIARRLLVDFHRRLAVGMSAADALAELQALPGDDADPAVAAAMGLICFGAS